MPTSMEVKEKEKVVKDAKFDRKYKTFIDMNELLDMDEAKLTVTEIVDKIRQEIIIKHALASASTIKEHCALYILVRPSKRCEWPLDEIFKAINEDITDALYIVMSYQDMLK